MNTLLKPAAISSSCSLCQFGKWHTIQNTLAEPSSHTGMALTNKGPWAMWVRFISPTMLMVVGTHFGQRNGRSISFDRQDQSYILFYFPRAATEMIMGIYPLLPRKKKGGDRSGAGSHNGAQWSWVSIQIKGQLIIEKKINLVISWHRLAVA